MTDKQIAEQIEDLKIVGARLRASKEEALQFLERAGILPLLQNYKPGKSGGPKPNAQKNAK